MMSAARKQKAVINSACHCCPANVHELFFIDYFRSSLKPCIKSTLIVDVPIRNGLCLVDGVIAISRSIQVVCKCQIIKHKMVNRLDVENRLENVFEMSVDCRTLERSTCKKQMSWVFVYWHELSCTAHLIFIIDKSYPSVSPTDRQTDSVKPRWQLPSPTVPPPTSVFIRQTAIIDFMTFVRSRTRSCVPFSSVFNFSYFSE